MKKQLLALMCAFAFVGNATAVTCDELKAEFYKVRKNIRKVTDPMQPYVPAERKAKLDDLKKQAENLTKEMENQGCK